MHHIPDGCCDFFRIFQVFLNIRLFPFCAIQAVVTVAQISFESVSLESFLYADLACKVTSDCPLKVYIPISNLSQIVHSSFNSQKKNHFIVGGLFSIHVTL